MALGKKINSVLEHLKQSYDQPWYLPGLCLITFLNVFFVVLPVEPIMIAGVMLRPQRWFKVGAWMTVAGTLGTVLMAYLIVLKGQAVVDWLAPHAQTSASWMKSLQMMRDWGTYALVLISALPLPVLPAVAFAALSKVSMFEIGLASLIGRFIKFGGIAYCSAKFPALLRSRASLRSG